MIMEGTGAGAGIKEKGGPWKEEVAGVIKEQNQEQDQEKEEDFLLGSDGSYCECSVCLNSKKNQEKKSTSCFRKQIFPSYLNIPISAFRWLKEKCTYNQTGH